MQALLNRLKSLEPVLLLRPVWRSCHVTVLHDVSQCVAALGLRERQRERERVCVHDVCVCARVCVCVCV